MTTSQDIKNVSQPISTDMPEHLAAYRAIEPELDAMDEASFLPINTDPESAASQVLSTEAVRQTLVSDLKRMAPTFEVEQLDRVRNLALALVWADRYYSIASKRIEKLPQLDDEAGHIEDVLRPTAEALAKLGLIDGSRLAELPTAHGYRNRVHVLGAFEALFRTNWDKLKSCVPFDAKLLERSFALTREMSDLLAVRERTSPEITDAARRRSAAYTLLMRAWPKIQAVVNYIRSERSDAENFAPSLFVRAAPERNSKQDDKTVACERNASSDANAGSKGDVPQTPKPVLIPGFDKDGKPVLLAPKDAPNAVTVDPSRNIPSHLPGGNPFTDA